MRQDLPSGGQASLRYEAARNDTEPKQFVLNPYYENNLVLEVTQPLLRNFGNEVNQARITIARYTQRISLLDFRKAVEENIATIEQTYWQLVFAERDVAIQERLLGRTVDTSEAAVQAHGAGCDARADVAGERRPPSPAGLRSSVPNRRCVICRTSSSG